MDALTVCEVQTGVFKWDYFISVYMYIHAYTFILLYITLGTDIRVAEHNFLRVFVTNHFNHTLHLVNLFLRLCVNEVID